MIKNFLIATGIFFLLEFYVFEAVKTLTTNHWLRSGYWIITILVYAVFILGMFLAKRALLEAKHIQFLITLFLVFILPKILVVIFLLIDDLARLSIYAIKSIQGSEAFYPGRRKFLSTSGLALGGVFAALFLDGVIFGKYRFKVRKVRLKIAGLPKSFKGYKVLQISDVHSGTFLNPEKIQHAIDLINKQNADLVLFTGDLVNNKSEEFEPFVKLFSTIKGKDGKFSILGNHDYGDYAVWNSAQEKEKNLQHLFDLEKAAGFDLLLDEHRVIERNGEKLYLIGVQNWGEKPFPQLGDLDKATQGIPAQAAKILMSHDPTHFDAIVKTHPSNVQLTLSGHTHGMQFGIDLKNLRWSPAQYRYKKWADLYESNGKYLYVNRGFGVIGYPGRVGIDPEITVFELQ